MNAKQLQKLASAGHILDGAISLRSLGYDSVAWGYPHVLALAKDLARAGYIILGADVIRRDSEKLLHATTDSTYYKPAMDADDIARSCAAFMDYVLNYIERNGEGFLFDVIISDAFADVGSQGQSPGTAPGLRIADEASVSLMVLNESSDSLQVAADIRHYHLLHSFALDVSKSSIIEVAEKFRDFHRTHSGCATVALGASQAPFPHMVFAIAPVDGHSGRAEVVVSRCFDDGQASAATRIIAYLSQVEEFGNELTRMARQGVGGQARLVDRISFG